MADQPPPPTAGAAAAEAVFAAVEAEVAAAPSTRPQRASRRSRRSSSSSWDAESCDTELIILSDNEQPVPEEATPKRATAKRADKWEGYYPIDSIVGHQPAKEQGKLEFRLVWSGKWKSTEKFSWEPEHHLDGCISMLKDYRAANKLGPTTIKRRTGAGPSDKIQRNESLWPEVELVEAKINCRRSSTGSIIPLVLFDANDQDVKLLKQDALYIYYRDRHTYMILHYYKEKRALIADGENIITCNDSLKEELTEILGDCQYLTFMSQTCVDHCASSAIMLGLKFLRIEATRCEWPSQYYAPAILHKEVKDELYAGKSDLIDPLKANINFRPRLNCPFEDCDWSTKKTQQNCLSLHIYRKHN